jgi:hypothetical protein
LCYIFVINKCNRVARSGSGSSISSISDYEYRNQCGERPLVRVPRDIIRAPTPPPVVQRVVERAPTPEPDVVERVIVRPQPQQLIERIIERPRTPPPKIIDKEICEPAPPPIVRTRIVKVDHSARHYANAAPIRYAPSPRLGPCNYGPCSDYDYYGYDRTYSTSYSTSDLFQPSSGYTTATTAVAPSAYVPTTSLGATSYYPTATSINYAQQPMTSYGVPSYSSAGYTYAAPYNRQPSQVGYSYAAYPRQY